ncbi:hypothetical protein [Bacillus sp. ISL-40]|nr:hypothetical protein [Bacillus sp. ISL-40]
MKYILIFIACGIISAFIAKIKKRPMDGWGIIGLIGGPIALLILL